MMSQFQNLNCMCLLAACILLSPTFLMAHTYPSEAGNVPQVETSVSQNTKTSNDLKSSIKIEKINVAQTNKAEHLIYTVNINDYQAHKVQVIPVVDCPAHVTVEIFPKEAQEIIANTPIIFHVFITADAPGEYIFTEILSIDGKIRYSNDGYDMGIEVSEHGYFCYQLGCFIENNWKWLLTTLVAILSSFSKYGRQAFSSIVSFFQSKRKSAPAKLYSKQASTANV